MATPQLYDGNHSETPSSLINSNYMSKFVCNTCRYDIIIVYTKQYVRPNRVNKHDAPHSNQLNGGYFFSLFHNIPIARPGTYSNVSLSNGLILWLCFCRCATAWVPQKGCNLTFINKYDEYVFHKTINMKIPHFNNNLIYLCTNQHNLIHMNYNKWALFCVHNTQYTNNMLSAHSQQQWQVLWAESIHI